MVLVAWWATNAKQVSTARGENVWLLGLFVAGGLPTPCFLLSFLWLVCWLVQPAWLVVCLDLEKIHTVMDGSWTGRNMLLFGVLVAGFACRDCLRDAVLDGYARFSVCVLGWMGGWMDGWMDGRMDPVLPHVPEASGSVSGGSRRSGQSLRSFRRIPKG